MRLMPGFFKNIPKPKKGKFKVYTGMYFVSIKNKEYHKRTFNNEITAYLAVRWLALIRDLKTLGHECGVVWGIEKIKGSN